ncbi:MAG: exodeoxyribonuclease III [Rhodobacteraceae bacterium]|jgi:exodeoxyribonuclease-3|nr:exodeoxyribonuclease III [Paracoccaceae bacterium]
MKIATYNINGIKARIEALPRWLRAEGADADVICLQEIKSQDAAFPREVFEDMGYTVATHGQKSFNGVAILSRLPLEDVTRGLPGDPDDEQARWIEATVTGTRTLRICGLYLPNGNPAPGPKLDYKLAWMARMEARVRALMALEEPVVFLGDFNVIPQPLDAAKPEAWQGDALFLPESRAAFRRILWMGLTEAIRARAPATPGLYTFWDYQANAWERGNGIRIDHVLLTAQAADLLEDAGIDKQVRAGDKPSDHVPVWVRLAA